MSANPSSLDLNRACDIVILVAKSGSIDHVDLDEAREAEKLVRIRMRNTGYWPDLTLKAHEVIWLAIEKRATERAQERAKVTAEVTMERAQAKTYERFNAPHVRHEKNLRRQRRQREKADENRKNSGKGLTKGGGTAQQSQKKGGKGKGKGKKGKG